MYFPRGVWIKIKDFTFDYKRWWKQKMSLCLAYKEHNESINYYKPDIFLYREQRYHFNLVKEYWVNKAYIDKDYNRMSRETVYRWVNFN